jgi:hypothetical protein
LSVTYNVNITADTTNNYHKFPTDVEYFQVITGMTYSQFSGQCSNQIGSDSLNNRYINNTTFIGQEDLPSINQADNLFLRGLDYVDDSQSICVLILNRGVDPYTPKVPISYGLGRLFGFTNESSKTITGYYHMNIPIQGRYLNVSHLSSHLSNSNISTDTYSNQNLYFNSFSYRPQILTITGELTGYTGGQPFTYIGDINSGYSGFSSNLISYYSYMDKTVMTAFFQPQCGGFNVANVTTLNTAVATADVTLGLRVSTQNRFSWRIYPRGYFWQN